MTKDQVVDEFSKIPGVSRKAAEALYAAGFHDLELLKKADRDRLKQVEGLGKKSLDALLAWQAEERGETPAPKQEIQVVEEKKPAKKAKEEVQVVEPEERVHKARAKPTLSKELEQALHTRAVLNKHRPTIRHDQWFRYDKLSRLGWRKPRGARNKVQVDMGYRPRRPVIGYRGPVLARGLHASGFQEVPVHNPKDLEGLDPQTQAGRIAHGVGGKKRAAILEAAQKKGIRILNPTGVKA
ncbi:MAG TPA: 50S ribosomal protein L32e [Candidatus Thermoplasmatota archaeon]|jgi:large subunit ribosomal protein L32e|nr:50S ribosomal protein L32e [Candidatus Thermoplasmatota archaeon]